MVRIIVYLSLFVIFFISYFPITIVKAQTYGWWNTSWLYRKPITIDNTQNPNTLTDYQVLITLDTQTLISQGKMRSDCGDIRFTDSRSFDSALWTRNFSYITLWGWRKPITINNTQNSNTLTDYQVLVTLDTKSLISAGKMRSDCGDIRFTDENNNLLNYWIESGCNTTSTKIWVKVPNIPASSSTTIYVYYGNSSATSLSNGDATFPLFDDFKGSSFNTSKWTTTTYWLLA